ILGFSERLKEKREKEEEDEEEDDGLYNSIREYTKELLKRLSNIEIVDVEFFALESYKCNNGRYDISGHITISFETSDIKNEIVLEISKTHATIGIKPAVMNIWDNRMSKLKGVADSCKNRTEFIENLFAAYVDYEVRKLDTLENNREFIKAQVRKTIENKFTDINRLLLVKKISDLDYKAELIDRSIVYTLNQKLSPEHPLVRFTSNIIGSTELDNRDIAEKILPVTICAGLLNKKSENPSYPNINLEKDRYRRIKDNIKYFGIFEYVLECDISIFIVWMKYFIDNCDLNEEGIYKSLHLSFVDKFCIYIFKDQNMEWSNIVDKTITRDYPEKKDAILNHLHYSWFLYLILENISAIELIKANFDAIQNPNYIPATFKYDDEKKIAQILTGLKGQICTSEGSTAKFYQLLRQYNPI
ncbi:hypothetical protein NEAUS05_2540, partial [Nematocida ausubeli]